MESNLPDPRIIRVIYKTINVALHCWVCSICPDMIALLFYALNLQTVTNWGRLKTTGSFSVARRLRDELHTLSLLLGKTCSKRFVGQSWSHISSKGITATYTLMASCGYSCLVAGVCGSSSFNPANAQCIAISECRQDVYNHLVYCKISNDTGVDSESKLLLARAGRVLSAAIHRDPYRHLSLTEIRHFWNRRII